MMRLKLPEPMRAAIEEAAAAAAQASRTAHYAGHNWHPLFIEGVATLAAELYEQ